jgi:pregnancy-associated plasma protein-A/flagellar hook capping protein FlgD
MSKHAIVLLVCLGLCGAAPALASSPIVVNGKTYATWTEYFLSDEFRANGLRCGTRSPSPEALERSRVLQGSSDCTLDLTNPSNEYAPDDIFQVLVVVHRLESITGNGVFPDALVQSQIDVMNEDFRATPGTLGAGGTDTRIEFKLATVDPDGNPSLGWTRTQNEFWFNDLPDPLNGNYWDTLAWDPTRYLNIYTLSPEAPGGLILGYVPYLPQEGAGQPDDGVRCLWSSFGRNSGNPPYDLGRTVTHEVGHYLGLYHVFQDGCTAAGAPGCYSSGDRICDTEPDEASHGGCPTDAMTCGDPDPIRNYLEYTDDLCMNNFTIEQARRMRCSMTYYRPSGYTEIPVVGVERPLASAPGVRLEQNAPNPFAGHTLFSFELAREGDASLTVLDLAGRAVRTLAAGRLGPGVHRLSWDGTDGNGRMAPPGVYFYRLTAPEASRTLRMVMLR